MLPLGATACIVGGGDVSTDANGFRDACEKGHLEPCRQYPAAWNLQGTVDDAGAGGELEVVPLFAFPFDEGAMVGEVCSLLYPSLPLVRLGS